MPEKNCGNCEICTKETSYCVLRQRKVSPSNVCNDHTPMDLEEEPAEESVMDAKIIEMYSAGKRVEDIASCCGMSKSNMYLKINKIIDDGHMDKRAKIVPPTENIVLTPKEEIKKKEFIPRDTIPLSVAAEMADPGDVSDCDLQFIADLIDGAEKVIIHRKTISVTIDFTQGN